MLRRIPLQRLKRSTLFVDMLSVKVFPKTLLLQVGDGIAMVHAAYVRTCMRNEDVLVYEVHKNSLRNVQM